MLTDEQAQAIERQCRSGAFDRAQATRWIVDLLDDRRERVAWLTYVGQRLADAFMYFEGLCDGRMQRPRGKPAGRAASPPAHRGTRDADTREARTTQRSR